MTRIWNWNRWRYEWESRWRYVLRSVYTKRQFQPRVNAAMMLAIWLSLRSMKTELLQNVVATRFGATLFWSMKTMLQASLQRWLRVDVDAWCKWALNEPLEEKKTSLPPNLVLTSNSVKIKKLLSRSLSFGANRPLATFLRSVYTKQKRSFWSSFNLFDCSLMFFAFAWSE